MSGEVDFIIGSQVVCSDGICGNLRRVIVDPIGRTVTHLVVEPDDLRYGGRLVPIALVDPASREIRLRSSRAELEALEEADESRFWLGATGEWGYEQSEMLSQPYFGLSGVGGFGGMGAGGIASLDMVVGPQPVTYDKVPAGEVEVRRGDHVQATDGRIGRVQGLVIDPGDHQVTHVLLEEGHLWGKKQVAIPIAAVTSVDDGVQLNLTKDQVRDLPAVGIDRDG